MTTRFRLMLTAAVMALAAPAQAANLALVLDAGEADAEAIGLMGDALNARGYEVFERVDADREAMREAIASLSERLHEAERLLLVFAGPVWASEGRVTLLPAGFEGETPLDAAFDGVPVEILLDLAAERPGRSAVVVAYDDLPFGAEEAEGAGIAAEDAAAASGRPESADGWARAVVPQGVLVLAGPREATLEAVTERLLTEGTAIAEAVSELDDEIKVYGFASPDARFGGNGDEAEAAEQPQALPEIEAAEPDEEPEPEPGPDALAEAGEAALALDQAARQSVQEDLTVLGFATRGIDGVFGPGTRAAVAEWQEAEGFEATGFLDAAQLARLREQASARTAELAEAAERARAEEEAADAAFWRTTGAGGTAADLRAYLARYPDGIYAEEARAQLDALEADARAEAEAEDRAEWDAALAEGSPEALRGYLEARPDGAFAPEAEALIAEIEEAPARDAAEAEALAREEALGLNTASRALIEGQLQAAGYEVGAADGAFDADTRAALRAFQQQQGLEATGYVDQATVQALIVASLGLR